jgi:hypothetical protein
MGERSLEDQRRDSQENLTGQVKSSNLPYNLSANSRCLCNKSEWQRPEHPTEGLTTVIGGLINSPREIPCVERAGSDDPLVSPAIQFQPASHFPDECFQKEQRKTQPLKKEVEFCDHQDKSDGKHTSHPAEDLTIVIGGLFNSPREVPCVERARSDDRLVNSQVQSQ